MPQSIRVAVLGYGLAGRVFHCPFVSAIPGLHLEAIVQRRGDDAAEIYPQARILRSADEAINDPEVDVVVVATPNNTHEALALQALRAGKHVVVDKPVAATSGAVRGLIDAAKKAGKLLIPFHNRRWDGDFLTLQEIVAGRRLGRMVKVISRFDRFRPKAREGSWKEAADPSHGLLLDLGPHLLDQAITLFGTPSRLTASVRTERDDSRVDDAFDIVLTFDQGPGTFHYECHATQVAAEPGPRFQAHGTAGSYIKHGLDAQETHLKADGRHPPQLESSVPWIEEPETAWGTLAVASDVSDPEKLERTLLHTRMGDYRLFYAGVRDAVLGKGAPPVSAEDAWRVARLLELARQSSEERRTVDVDLSSK